MEHVADFETTTDENDCRVWGWGIQEIESKAYKQGKDINQFMRLIQYDEIITTVYFHNLKFDGEFILNWLFASGWKHSTQRKPHEKEFTTLISDMGIFYQIKINCGGKMVKFLDSLKIIPLPVKLISKAFGLIESKGEIDYTMKRPVGYEPTIDEWEYIKTDIVIVVNALELMFNTGLNKMTQAGNALDSFKSMIDKKSFVKLFPQLQCDKWLRRAYRGGYTYCNPRYQGKEMGDGSVYDVNSLYPYVMHKYPMPYGMPVWYDGRYEYDKLYNLYVCAIECQFELKKGYLPTIQMKNSMRFIDTEYLTSSNDEMCLLVLSNVDLEMFLQHYDVFNIEWIGGYKFKSNKDLFKPYIDKWTEIKIHASLMGNTGQRTIAKLMMNALYGKFGLNPHVCSKIPRYDDINKMVQYRNGGDEIRPPLYIPVAIFTTAYARRETITAAQLNYNRFIYADTDSLHLIGTEMPVGIEVDKSELGKWKHENNFTRAKFIRAKSYVEEIDGELHITCAGMPTTCHKGVTYDNFERGLKVGGKLQHKRVSGGVVLRETEFTIKM